MIHINEILKKLVEITRRRFEEEISALINEALERERAKRK
jgi:hypothetical protein